MTKAFNAALLGSTAYDAAVLNTHIMKREVYIPAGNYRIIIYRQLCTIPIHWLKRESM